MTEIGALYMYLSFCNEIDYRTGIRGEGEFLRTPDFHKKSKGKPCSPSSLLLDSKLIVFFPQSAAKQRMSLSISSYPFASRLEERNKEERERERRENAKDEGRR